MVSNINIYGRIDEKKIVIDKIRPFEGHYLKQIREYYRIGLTWTSNALEGNTLNETETKILLEDGLTIGGKPLRDIYEAVGHSAAYNFMFELINHKYIDCAAITEMHRLFYRAIDEKNAGIWRDTKIFVTGSDYVFPEPEKIGKEIDIFEDWVRSERKKYHPVKFAALLHLKFVTIHPFVDGNGRVSRLLMNLALIQDGYMIAVIPPILRYEYMTAIQKYQKTGNDKEFCELIAEQVHESQKEIIRLLQLK